MSRHRKPRKSRTPLAALAAVAGGAITLAALFAASPSGSSQSHRAASVLPAVTLHAPDLTAAVQVPEPAVRTYAVRSGDTLWTIAQKQCHDGSRWQDLARASRIDGTGVLKIGEVITLSC